MGESKAAARNNVAQKAVDVLRPIIEAEFERRKVEKEQKLEAKKAEREERLKQQEVEDDMGKESQDKIIDGNAHGVIKQSSQTNATALGGTVAGSSDKGNGDAAAEETKPRIKGIPALKVLKQIRPHVACTQKENSIVPDGYEAQVEVDGVKFEGQGYSLALAKSVAAALALSSIFNISFEFTPRKNLMFSCFLVK